MRDVFIFVARLFSVLFNPHPTSSTWSPREKHMAYVYMLGVINENLLGIPLPKHVFIATIVSCACRTQLVEDVIRDLKPQVVMVELDAYRSRLLPPGEVHKVGV